VPEREDPGNPDFSTSSIPKVVGGDGPDALAAACALYGAVVEHVIPVSSTETAEAVKITENVFRAVIVYGRIGIDIFEVIDAAKTKPFGFMPFYPGPGLGGHCIPIDPFYLTWRARRLGMSTPYQRAGLFVILKHTLAVCASATPRCQLRNLTSNEGEGVRKRTRVRPGLARSHMWTSDNRGQRLICR
jgi:UDP-glucose/GDP-mannose dehydrogenase family, central domain